METHGHTPGGDLPAYARQLKAALDQGLRPRKGGGCIVVTTDWNYARAFDPGRLVCPPDQHPEDLDFSFLAGCEVIVLVPEPEETLGKALLAQIQASGAKLAVLAVHRTEAP